jgi:hypothetical protein
MALDRPAAAPRRNRGALAGYVVVWLIGAAAVVGGVAVALSGGGEDTVALPPVRQIELAAAARSAGCEFRRTRRGEVTNPPVDGARAAAPESPGVKDDPPSREASLIAALRRGVVVIHYQPGLADDRVDELKKMQEAVPEGTIVTPNTTRMTYAVAATAYHRLLGCAHFTDATLDALRLFRGRYVGSGPDR